MARSVTISMALIAKSFPAGTLPAASYVCHLEVAPPLVAPPDVIVAAGAVAGSPLRFQFPAVAEGGPYIGSVATLDAQGHPLLDRFMLPGFTVDAAPSPTVIVLPVPGAPVTITIA